MSHVKAAVKVQEVGVAAATVATAVTAVTVLIAQKAKTLHRAQAIVLTTVLVA